MSIVITLGLAFPLVCWVLAARTARVSWTIATVLTLCVAAEIALVKDSILASAKITLLVLCALGTVTALVAGVVVEGRRVGMRPLRSAGVRGITGLILSVVYGVVALCTVLLLTVMVLLDGPPAATPSSAEVLPLPAGLAVAENRDEGCSSGSQTICSRVIEVRSATGLSAADVAQQLRDHLAYTDGWQLPRIRIRLAVGAAVAPRAGCSTVMRSA